MGSGLEAIILSSCNSYIVRFLTSLSSLPPLGHKGYKGWIFSASALKPGDLRANR
jgi:hypothetical protein